MGQSPRGSRTGAVIFRTHVSTHGELAPDQKPDRYGFIATVADGLSVGRDQKALREHLARGGDARSWWLDEDDYLKFRARLLLCNAGLVSRFATWPREDAGLYLMGLGWREKPLTCVRTPLLLIDDRACHERTTMLAMENVSICESCERELMEPSAWVDFGRRYGLEMDPGMIELISRARGDDVSIPGRQLDMLQRALAAALGLAECHPHQSIRAIVEQLNAKGAGLDRERIAPHIRAGFDKLLNRKGRCIDASGRDA